MHIRLDEEEIAALFRNIDRNNNQSISYNEIIESFSAINTEQLIAKVQRVIKGSKIDPEFYFNKFALEDSEKKQIS